MTLIFVLSGAVQGVAEFGEEFRGHGKARIGISI
jgi:hypothetical protein